MLRLVALGDTMGAVQGAYSIREAMLRAGPDAGSYYAWWWAAGRVFAMGGSTAHAREAIDTLVGRCGSNCNDTELVRAWIALADGEPERAIAHVSAAERGCYYTFLDPRRFSLLRGRAHEAAARPDSAIADYETYLGGVVDLETDAIFLFDTLERLGRLNEQIGRGPGASAYYERAADLWKDADPELQPRVQRLRERAAALRGGANAASPEAGASDEVQTASAPNGEPAP